MNADTDSTIQTVKKSASDEPEMKIPPDRAHEDLKQFLKERGFTQFDKIKDQTLSNFLKCDKDTLKAGLIKAGVSPFQFPAFIDAIGSIPASNVKSRSKGM